MAAFDPDAATAAYMATLSLAAHAQATAYTQGGHWLLLWDTIVAVVSAGIIFKLGLLASLKAWIERRRPRPNLAALVCLLVFLAADFLLQLPWSIYSDWWRERSYGLTHQPFGGWFGEAVLAATINAVVSALLAIAIYALMRHRPRSWWAWSGAVSAIAIVLLVVLSPVLIEPLFNRYTPAPAGPTRDAVVALARRTGVPSDKIYVYNGSKQSDRYTANVSGLFGSARVAMSDTMFKQNADIAEVRGVVGHEMGHYARGHVFLSALVLSLIAVVGFLLADRLFPWFAGRLSDGTSPPTVIADPAGLPILVIVFAILSLLATPLFSTLTRLEESDADRFSLAFAHEPDGLSKALVKTIAYRASSPSPLEEAIFYDHPSVERRVRRAMMWKAQHPDLVGR